MVDVSGLSVGASVGLVIGSAANSSIKENRVSGVIYAYEPAFNLLLMKSKGAHNGVANWRFIPIQSIQQVLSSEMTSEDMSLPEMNEEIAARREERAFQWAVADAERIGEGVTREAQAIFDALCKTMPSKWQEKSILVLDEVLVEAPYKPEAAKLCQGSLQEVTLQRVRKVLAAERDRLGL